MSDHVTLRPVAEADLTLVDALAHDPEVAGEYAWAGWVGGFDYRAMWVESRLLGEGGGMLVVAREGIPLGFVTWTRRPRSIVGHAWELGIALLPEARAQGVGTAATNALVAYLFAHTTAMRLEAVTEADNVGAQRVLERTGFVREGVLRSASWRDGDWRDGVVYSRLRTD